jgi:metal-responsive CopG/Arc/MetJ family transcriptional regulator
MPLEKTHPITIRVSQELLNEIDELTPDRRACRERFVMDAVQAYLGHSENVIYKHAEAKLMSSHR